MKLVFFEPLLESKALGLHLYPTIRRNKVDLLLHLFSLYDICLTPLKLEFICTHIWLLRRIDSFSRMKSTRLSTTGHWLLNTHH